MNKIYDISFSRVEISNKIKLKLLKKLKAIEIFCMKRQDLGMILGERYEQTIEKILDIDYRKSLERYLNYLEKNKIEIISFKDDIYPIKLSYIEDKPTYLFIRGNREILDEDNVAIVGSRNATESGKLFTRKLAKEIADRNVNVVSGLAIGVDKYAHLGALDSNLGKTIAVLGTGLADSDIYPLQNKKIFDRILEEGGAAVSEYVIGTKPLKHHFPLRNRIISGLSEKVVIIEATEKSGSLITANYALEQGKDIYAVPGRIDDINTKGTNMLIKDGAYLLEGAEDLFINY